MLRRLRRALTAVRTVPARARLTVEYHGWRSLLLRLVTAPLRLTPLRRALPWQGSRRHDRARHWYRTEGRPVTVVIPTYGPPDEAITAVASIRRSTSRRRTSIVVADDGSPPEHQQRLRQLRGVTLVLGERNAGFAANVNRGIRAANPDHDVIVLNSDVRAHDDWLELLQHAVYADERIGIAGPKLLYPDGRIQSAGSHRNLGAPDWFDHRYRFAPSSHGPAGVPAEVLGVTAACIYIRRAVIDSIGLMDEGFGMAFEDMDYCLRAWDAGFRVIYEPDATLTHLESATRGMTQGERELRSQQHFWRKWGEWFDGRDVRTPDGALRIVYVTEDTGVGGGHRVVFEHLNRLRARGHDVALYTLGDPAIGWFDLDVPVRAFDDYEDLVEALAPQDAIKVATWWNTARPVWLASVGRGIPVYFVQDIETSYYPGQAREQNAVLASYRHEFRYLTTSRWNEERLHELGLPAVARVTPGVDLDTFRESGAPRRDDVVLAVGRTQPLKNVELTLAAVDALPEPRPELWMFGVEPEVGTGRAARYFEAPSDEEVNGLYNQATVFVQTSRHEGFCLPLLEAMAAGVPVVCTDADGNRDFCEDGVNCLLVDATPEAVSSAIARLLSDPALRERLVAGGRATARQYGWTALTDELEAFFATVAGDRRAAERVSSDSPT